MKEALRLHPTLPLLVPHCPSETCTVGGYTVPNGSRVFVNVWAIQRDPSIWKNPREFCPERFFDNKWDDNGNDVNYFPFGSGRRICAGIVMAERIFMYGFTHSFFRLEIARRRDIRPYREVWDFSEEKSTLWCLYLLLRFFNPTLYE